MPKPMPLKGTPKGMLPNISLPEESALKEETPEESQAVQSMPQMTAQLGTIPEESPKLEETPTESPQLEETPIQSAPKEEMPSDFIEENCVVVNGKKIEIKPTKLKYFRNKSASAYGIIKAVPLHELLTYGKGIIDESRDADQLLYDFLVAAFDDSTFVRDNYDNLDSDTIDKVVKIFGRINHIDEKEEAARKNKEAQAKR